MIRGFLFDLGGTLFDYRGSTETDLFRMCSQRSYQALAHDYAIRIDYPTYYRLISRGFLHRWIWALATGREIETERLFRGLTRPLGIRVTRRAWPRIERAWHAPMRERCRLLEGAVDLLAALKDRGLRLGVASNTIWSRDIVMEMLGDLGLSPFFDAFTFSSELGYRKPHRRFYLVAARRLGLSRSRLGFVGNQAREDVRGPERHGIRAIHISKKRRRFPLLVPRHQARDLREVKEIALEWAGKRGRVPNSVEVGPRRVKGVDVLRGFEGEAP